MKTTPIKLVLSFKSFLLFAFSMALVHSGFAQLSPIGLESRIAESNLVVEGQVVSSHSTWDTNESNIYTINTVLVTKVFDGVVFEDHIEVVTLGGIVGMIKEDVSHSLQLSVGDYGMFTLQHSQYNINGVTAAYTATAGPQGLVQYDTESLAAEGVFDEYESVEEALYPQVESIVGHSAEIRTTLNWRRDNASATESSFFVMPIVSITPSTQNAGTGETIIIQGSGFGATMGKINFSDADDGGSSFIGGLPSEILSWTDTEIEVAVSQSAGTGPIQVVTNSAGTLTSPNPLTVPFAVGNTVFDAGSGDEAYVTTPVDRNGTGGYTWQMFTGFAANTDAAASFTRALDTWTSSSCVNWIIGETTAVDSAINDGVNVVRFDIGTELPTGVLGRCTSRFSGCFIEGGSSVAWYVSELDIVFNDSETWNFNETPPAFGEYDFESVAVHELGHGHQLGHVIDSSMVMHYSISNGESNRDIGAGELEGANSVMARATTFSDCSQNPMSIGPGCCVQPENPMITLNESSTICPGASITLTIVGELNSATAWHVYSGSCGGTLVGTTTSEIEVSPLVNTTYFVRGEDGAGCVDEGAASCGSIGITTEDNTPPTLSGPSDQFEDVDENCEFVLPDYTALAIAEDNCTQNLAVTQSPVAGTVLSGAGSMTTVTLSTEDLSTNAADYSFDVNLADGTAPIITSCVPNQTVAGDEFTCTSNLLDYTSLVSVTDNCDLNPIITQTPNSGTLISGSLEVEISVLDGSGNSTQCTFTVSVEDSEPPVITCPSSFSATLGSACEYVIPDLTNMTTIADNCDPSPALTQVPAIGTIISMSGDQSVWLYAQDISGNADSCEVIISIQDNTDPVISCPNNFTVNINENCEYTLPDFASTANASDNCSGLVVTQLPAPGTVITSAPNVVEVTLTAVDGSSNTVDCSFEINIMDGEAPQILTCVEDKVVTGDTDCIATLADYTSEVLAVDNCDGTPSVVQSPAAGTVFSGTQTILIIVSDAAGNPTTCSFNVTVEDLTPPTIECPSGMTESLDESCEFIIPDLTASAVVTDNCTFSPSVVQSPAAGTIVSGLGTTIVTLTAEDDAGLQADCGVIITLVDDTNPTIDSCPSSETVFGDENCEAVLTDYTTQVFAFDACGVVSIEQSPSAGTVISGTQIVTITATDDSFNQATCDFTVTVETDASFAYGEAAYCGNLSDVTPTISGASGGTFSSTPAGLSIQSTDGTISPSASIPGEYSVTYTLSTGCTGSHTEMVSILDSSLEACGGTPVSDDCSEAIVVPTLLHGEATFVAAPLSVGTSETGCAGDANDAVWFRFTAGSSKDVLFARDPAGGYDVAIEVYNTCDGNLLGCGNNYGAGELERFMPDGLTAGQDYFVKVYDISSAVNAGATVELMVNTFADGEVLPAFCGRTDYELDDIIMSERQQLGQLYNVPAVPVKGYAFRIMQGDSVIGTRFINEIDGFYTPLYAIGELTYDTQYEVSVAHQVRMQVNGTVANFWSDFGTSCPIGLESSAPVTRLRDQFCDSPQTFSLSNNVMCDIVVGADQYQFEFVSGATTLLKSSGNYSLNLYQVQGLVLNTTYDVRVRARVGGEWIPFGPVCALTLDATPPLTQLRSAYCGGTYNTQQSSSIVICDRIQGADQYEFMFDNNGQSQSAYSGNHVFSLSNAPFLEDGNQYQVSVRARIGNIWGAFGDSCAINIGELIGRAQVTDEMSNLTKSLETTPSELSVYPNPNDGTQFKVRIAKQNENGAMTLQLLDMQGRLVSTRNVAYNGETEILWTTDSTLESGVYFVRTIDQNGLGESIRMIVR